MGHLIVPFPQGAGLSISSDTKGDEARELYGLLGFFRFSCFLNISSSFFFHIYFGISCLWLSSRICWPLATDHIYT